METKWKDKIFFGTREEDNACIWLSRPSWDCGWYWGFGYLGNREVHYHLKSYQDRNRVLKDDKGDLCVVTERRNKHMYDCLLEDYDLNPKIKKNLWEFCELVETIYTLKEAAEVLGRGGSHYANNPCKEIIINKEEVERINKVVIPAMLDALYDLMTASTEEEEETL